MTRRALRQAALAILCGFGAASPAAAKDILVRMKTTGASGLMVFEPAYIAAGVGDRVRFVPADPGHNAEPIVGMAPDGATLSAGEVNKDYVLTLTRPGLYGIKCKPHYAMGMVALVKAGDGKAPNAAAAAAIKLPPLAAKRMAAMLDQAR